MKRKIFLISVLLLIAGATLFFFINPKIQPPQACFKNNCFLVELALTEKEQAQGLMFRESLAENKGMLFLFEKEGNYPFWMKNTLIPLDIIWLSENKKVIFISHNTQPCQAELCLPIIPTTDKAKYVLEINAGLSQEIGLSLEDKVELTF